MHARRRAIAVATGLALPAPGRRASPCTPPATFRCRSPRGRPSSPGGRDHRAHRPPSDRRQPRARRRRPIGAARRASAPPRRSTRRPCRPLCGNGPEAAAGYSCAPRRGLPERDGAGGRTPDVDRSRASRGAAAVTGQAVRAITVAASACSSPVVPPRVSRRRSRNRSSSRTTPFACRCSSSPVSRPESTSAWIRSSASCWRS